MRVWVMDSPEEKANAILVHRRSQLEALSRILRVKFPRAQISAPANPCAAVSAATIVLVNGWEISFGLDADMPDLFYEVVRFRGPADPAHLPFEQHNLPDSSLTNRLTLGQVLAVMFLY